MAQFKHNYKIGDVIVRDHEFMFTTLEMDTIGEGPFTVTAVEYVELCYQNDVAHSQSIKTDGHGHWVSAAWFEPKDFKGNDNDSV